VRKEIVLLVIGILLLSINGCSGHDQPGTSSAQPVTGRPAATVNQAATTVRAATQQAANSNPDATGNSSLYDQSLVFPDGKVITSDIGQIGYGWKGLGIQLCTMWAYPGSGNALRNLVGNHVVRFSQQPVTLDIGPEVMVSVDRDSPAASGSNTVHHEIWLIVFHPDPQHTDRQIAYTLQARLGAVSPDEASFEILELAKTWDIPALHSSQPGLSIKLGPASGPQVSVAPGATVAFNCSNGIIPVFVSVDDKIISSDLPVQVAVKPDGWYFEAKIRPSGSEYYFIIRVDPTAPRTGEVTLSNICDQNDKVLVAGPITFGIALAG
jgi:hypothetical protein